MYHLERNKHSTDESVKKNGAVWGWKWVILGFLLGKKWRALFWRGLVMLYPREDGRATLAVPQWGCSMDVSGAKPSALTLYLSVGCTCFS